MADAKDAKASAEAEEKERAAVFEARKAAEEKRATPAFQKRMKEAFDLHDKKGAKSIPTSELGSALRSVGKRLTNDHITQLSKKADTECGGKITFEDFKKFVETASDMEKTDRDVAGAFKIFSEGQHGGNGVDLATLRHALSTMGDKLTAKQIDAFLVECGFRQGETHGWLDLEKFMKVIHSTDL